MRPSRRLLLLGLLFLTAAGLRAGETKTERPRVLVIGDSVYRQPVAELTKSEKEQREIVYVSLQPGEVCNTTTALESLDRWLGDVPWDLIHFNFGLGDLVHRAPGMKAFRVLPIPAGGVRSTSPEQYEANLRELVDRLKATEAHLVWASTTPIRHSATRVFEKGSEIEYNNIAARVMKEQGVPINDMYSYVFELIDMSKPASHNADPFSFDKKPIHPPILEAIQAHLPLTQESSATAPP